MIRHPLLLLSAVTALSAASPGGAIVANVRDFGALGDGTTDDSAAISRAIANASHGGVVYFPPGQYGIGPAPVVLTGHAIELRGAGAHARSCTSAGSSLLALSNSNSTVLDIRTCSECIVAGFLIGHAAAHTAAVASSHAVAPSHTDAALCASANAMRYRPRGRGARRRRPYQPNKPAPSPPTTRAYADAAALPTTGSAIVVRSSFVVELSDLWISNVWTGVSMVEQANSVTILDTLLSDVYGPFGFYAGGGGSGNHTRVDILQMSRITTNNDDPRANTSCVWLDIGSGTNTVRLDNVRVGGSEMLH